MIHLFRRLFSQEKPYPPKYSREEALVVVKREGGDWVVFKSEQVWGWEFETPRSYQPDELVVGGGCWAFNKYTSEVISYGSSWEGKAEYEKTLMRWLKKYHGWGE